MSQQSDILFSPLILRGHRLKNRIFSSGHMTVLLQDGLPSDAMVAYHEARAKGGAGLIIIEAARVHASGMSGRPALRAYNDACVPGYRRLADVVHSHDCKIFAQLTHPGREMTLAADGTHAVAYAPSAAPNERFHVMPREMPQAMILEIADGFEASAARLREAGLDGVEVVASHGYLLAQFLNPRVNRRSDGYGSSFKNRLRIVREVLAASRRGAGPDMVVGIRLSGDEMDHDGLEQGEVLDIAQYLAADCELDYINVTAGTSAGLAGSTHIVPSMAFDTAYAAPLSAAIRRCVDLPIFVTGRINQPQIAESVLSSGQADMCGMTRALICDPEMPAKAREGQLENIRACVACNQACIGHMLNGYPISCIQHPETGRELEFGELKLAVNRRKVFVIGGGPAGMKAASIAARRGHAVTLFEAKAVLGGQCGLAQLLPGRAEFGGVTTNLAREMELCGVDVRLNKPVIRADIEAENPDIVVLATGALPYTPDISGGDEANIVDAWQVLRGEANVGSRVAIADWRCDWIGLGLAERLVREGCHVRLVVSGAMAGQTIQQYARDKWLGDLHHLGVEVIPHARLFGIDGTCTYFQHVLSGEAMEIDGVDTLVTAFGHRSDTSLPDSLIDWPGETHIIGDCLCVRTVEEAVLDGLRAGCQI